MSWLRWWLLAVLALACNKDQPTVGASTSSGAPTNRVISPPASVLSRPLPSWPSAAHAPSARDKTSLLRTRPLSRSEAQTLLPEGEHAAIQLHAVGSEPRRARRYRADRGGSGRVVVELDAALEVVSRGERITQPVPSMRITLDTSVAQANADLIELRASIAKVELMPRDDAARAVAAEMRSIVAKVAGLRGVLRLNPQGVTTGAPSPPPKTARELLQLWSSVAEAVGDMVVAMPLEPIGVGARWDVVDRVRRAGVVMIRKSSFTLSAEVGGELLLEASVREVGAADGAVDPALPPDMRLDVLAASAIGKRRIRIRGAELVPLASRTEVASDLQLRVTPEHGKGAEPVTSTVKLTQLLSAVRGDMSLPRRSTAADAGR